jgi:SagB-type dehydrogenase family enzyme
MTWRYQERGYRYLFLDAGHVCQNLYLAAQEINCGVCAIAAFDDDKLNELLNIGNEQTAIYMAAVGKNKTEE